jgi:hypothetical protein
VRFSRAVLLCSLVLIPFFPSLSHAQTAVYGTVGLTQYGFTNNGNGVSYKTAGAGLAAGAFYNFRAASRLKAGVDVRGTYSPGYRGGEAGLAALRISFVPHHNRLRPFFEIGGGVVTSPYNESVNTPGFLGQILVEQKRSTNGDLMLDFGLDIRLTSSLDYRAFDYGAAATGTNNGADLGFLNTGLVYHF